MRKTLTFGNVSLSDFGCYYSGSNMWRKPQRMADTYSIPGKNGDLSIDLNSYSNISRQFDCYINGDFARNYSALVDALHSVQGYQRFECSEEPDAYMMALFTSEIEPDMWQFNKRGTFTLEFNFKPQKWLKSGEIAIEIDSSISLVNPTHQTATPLIEVTGTGSVTINDSILTLSTNTSTTIIDCAIQDAYEESINRNNALTVTNGFPVLVDNNTISVSGFDTVKLTPRWWRL